MALTALPPVPLKDIVDLPFTFQEWLRQITLILSASGISWSLINFTGSNLTDIQTRNHNDLQNIQGGAVGDYSHLTAAQKTDLTDGGDTTLHFHSADRSDSFKTIAVSGQSDVVADSPTDTLTLVAGTGITITTNAGTDTITLAGAAVTNNFGTIAVSGQSDIVADAASDTLNIAAGSGVTLTTNAGTDTLTITAAGTGGTVTSVALTAAPTGIFDISGSPVTTSGTLALSLDNQSANIVLAGPSTGSPATPAFRALVTDDIANDMITYAKLQNVTDARLLGRSAGSSGDTQEITVGSGLSLSGGALTSTGGISSGTSFPGSPSTDDIYYRTDRDLLYFYNGTRWLTIQQYVIPMVFYTVANAPTVSANTADVWVGPCIHPPTYDIWMEEFVWSVFVGATNNGTSYWAATLKSYDAGGAATTIVTANTSTDTASTYLIKHTSIGALSGTTPILFSGSLNKNSAPTNLLPLSPCHVIGRLVG